MSFFSGVMASFFAVVILFNKAVVTSFKAVLTSFRLGLGIVIYFNNLQYCTILIQIPKFFPIILCLTQIL